MAASATIEGTHSLRGPPGRLAWVGALALVGIGMAGAARAENVFIEQVGRPARALHVAMAPLLPSATAKASQVYAAPVAARPPEGIVPASGGNLAYTLQAGINNTVAHLQNGRANLSSVAILNGQQNNVGVWQGGSALRSQVTLIGTRGLNVGILQPAQSAPVNLLVARLPNGGLLIKR